MGHQSWLLLLFLVETGYLHVSQAGLELPTSGNPPACASQSAGIIGVSPRAQPQHVFITHSFISDKASKIYLFNTLYIILCHQARVQELEDVVSSGVIITYCAASNSWAQVILPPQPPK